MRTGFGTATILNLLKKLAFLAAFLPAFAATAYSQDTLDTILDRKKVIIGVSQDIPPLAFVNANQEPDGYNVDVARLVAKHLGVELEIKQAPSANRIPNLLTNQVDLLVANLGITPERAKQVAFTIPYVKTYTDVIALKSTSIASMDDLVGKKVAVSRGGGQDILLTKTAPEGVTIMRFEGEAAATQALFSGQVDAFAATNVLAATMMTPELRETYESKLKLADIYDSINTRKADVQLHHWLNTFLFFVQHNGELDELHRKWLGEPLPSMGAF